MPRTVTSSEAKAKFGELVKWTTEQQDEIIVKLYGEPVVVLMAYAEYAELEKLRKREQKRKVLDALDALRSEARRQNAGLTSGEAYQQAGFSEAVVHDTLAKDQMLADTNQ